MEKVPYIIIGVYAILVVLSLSFGPPSLDGWGQKPFNSFGTQGIQGRCIKYHFLAAKKMCSFCCGYVTGAMLLWMFFQCFTMYSCAQVLVVPFALANRWSVEEGHRDVLLRQQIFSVAGT